VLGATIVDSDVPAIYCLAGRPHTIVVTSGARDVLPNELLRAALAHEHAHLAGHHHLVLVLARALSRAFPVVGFFDLAAAETARLVEVLADDTAARRHGRRTVAEALLRLACGRIPARRSAPPEPASCPGCNDCWYPRRSPRGSGSARPRRSPSWPPPR